MATNHTENYQLNLWEPGDSFLRTEFNENTQKLDAALKAEANARASADAQKASTAALNALAQTVAKKGNCRVVTGMYVGEDKYSFTLQFDAPPDAVIICGNGHVYAVVRHGGNSANGSSSEMQNEAVWNGNDVTITGNWVNSSIRMNAKDVTYVYLALFCLS